MPNTFRKTERLSSRKLIDQLFKGGKPVKSYPIVVLYAEAEHVGKFPAQAAVAVSKRLFRKAHDRNRIKRLLREVYRHEKAGLYERLALRGKKIVLMVMYTGSELPELKKLEQKIIHCLDRLEF